MDKMVIKALEEKINDYNQISKESSDHLFFVLKALMLKFLNDNRRIDFSKNASTIKENFTFDQILEIWNQQPLGESFYQEKRKKIDPTAWQWLIEFVNESPLLRDENTDIIGKIYEEYLIEDDKKNNGIFYTPRKIADFMVTQLNQRMMDNLTILDPTCGSGILLSAAYDYVSRSLNKGANAQEKKKIHQRLLEKTLIGIDRDKMACLVTQLVLILKGDLFVRPRGIYTCDILHNSPVEDGSIDVVIANPPYVGHKEIDQAYRRGLKAKYAHVYRDKGDLSYCFTYRAWELLKDQGQFIYLTSRYFLEAHFAGGVRQFISDHFDILKVIDFNGNRVIEGVGVDPAILSLKKTARIDPNHYLEVTRFRIISDHGKKTTKLVDELLIKTSSSYQAFWVDQKSLKEAPWRLYTPMTKSIIEKVEKKAPLFLSQVGQTFQGIITGRDQAFVFKKDQIPFKLNDGTALKPWLKNKDVLANRVIRASQVLIYTDDIKEIEVEIGLMEHLSSYREKLENRRECRLGKRPWYFLQWGRDIKSFESKKIIFPYKAASNRFAVDQSGSCFSADIYGMVLNDRATYTEETLALLLNSRLYDFYFKSYAKKLGNNLYEYYPNTILKLKIPIFKQKELNVIKDYYDILISSKDNKRGNKREEKEEKHQDQFNNYLYTYFELNKDEIDEIEKKK